MDEAPDPVARARSEEEDGSGGRAQDAAVPVYPGDKTVVMADGRVVEVGPDVDWQYESVSFTRSEYDLHKQDDVLRLVRPGSRVVLLTGGLHERAVVTEAEVIPPGRVYWEQNVYPDVMLLWISRPYGDDRSGVGHMPRTWPCWVVDEVARAVAADRLLREIEP